MQQKIERLQSQLEDLKGRSSDTPSASNALDPLNQKLESKIVELEFQVVNYEREIRHLKTTNKNLFDSITSNRAHAKLHNLIYENAKLRAWLFENTSESINNTSGTSVTPRVDKPKLIDVTPYPKKLHASIPSHPIPQPREFSIVKHSNVIALGMFKIDPSQTSRGSCTLLEPEGHSLKATQGMLGSLLHLRVKDKSEIICGTCKQCFVTANHDACLISSVNALNSRANNLCSDVPPSANQRRPKTQVWKPKQVGFQERHSWTPKHRLPRFSLKWSPSGRSFDLEGKLVASKETNCPNDDKAYPSNPQEPIRKWFPNSTVFLGRNDHIAAILGYGDLKWGNITITRVYFVKGNHSTNLYTINLYDKASALPICLIAWATPTKSWLWHQRLSHLNFDTINDLVKNDLVSGLPKFKYAKEYLCPSCKQGKSKRASHPPKPVLNSKQRLHLLNMDLCGPMRVASINAKRTEFKNHALKEYFDTVGITHEASSTKTPQQNGVVERRNRTLLEAGKTMLIFSHASLFLWAEAIATACYTQNSSIIHRRFNKTPYELIQGRTPDISYLYVFGDLCYLKNDREDIGKLGAKGDIGFFIRYSANSVSYRVYNQRTKKIIETMNVTFDELSAIDFEQNSSTPVTPQRPIERDLDIRFKPLHNEYLGGQPSEAPRTVPAAPVIQNLQAPSASTSIQDSAPTPTNSSDTPISLHNVDEQSQPHAYQQGNHTPLPPASIADNVLNAVFEGDLFVNPFATPSIESVVSYTQYAWIESMQEELHQFIRLDVWELVPLPDGIKPLTLKWLLKNKHDEENTVIRNKTRLVMRGYRQEEGIDFENSFAP
uniref:Integrase catalytic domain-containing protein n=1 Tax=Tanacetum cinerariifolium TaxID=118510 RepID=A0A699GQ90_TANCI|nr:hypothetical protein [Tanacetum cinerariifolium]